MSVLHNFQYVRKKDAKVYIFEIMFCDRCLICLSNKSSCSENNFFFEIILIIFNLLQLNIIFFI